MVLVDVFVNTLFALLRTFLKPLDVISPQSNHWLFCTPKVITFTIYKISLKTFVIYIVITIIPGYNGKCISLFAKGGVALGGRKDKTKGADKAPQHSGI